MNTDLESLSSALESGEPKRPRATFQRCLLVQVEPKLSSEYLGPFSGEQDGQSGAVPPDEGCEGEAKSEVADGRWSPSGFMPTTPSTRTVVAEQSKRGNDDHESDENCHDRFRD